MILVHSATVTGANVEEAIERAAEYFGLEREEWSVSKVHRTGAECFLATDYRQLRALLATPTALSARLPCLAVLHPLLASGQLRRRADRPAAGAVPTRTGQREETAAPGSAELAQHRGELGLVEGAQRGRADIARAAEIEQDRGEIESVRGAHDRHDVV